MAQKKRRGSHEKRLRTNLEIANLLNITSLEGLGLSRKEREQCSKGRLGEEYFCRDCPKSYPKHLVGNCLAAREIAKEKKARQKRNR